MMQLHTQQSRGQVHRRHVRNAFRSPYQQRHRRPGFQCVAKAGTIKQLPIFPLGLVALPSIVVPLVIFEARYRVLFNTLLYGGTGVEEGLVQTDSAFCGSRQFGICFIRGQMLSDVGTMVKVDEYQHLQDGRIVVTNTGVERFKILRIVKERPVLVCEVEVLPEDDDKSPEAKALADEVADLFRETLRLHLKVEKAKVSEELQEPMELVQRTPRELSYFIASTIMEMHLQQSLLQEDSTVKRLEREKEVLRNTVQFYSAASALNSVFDKTSEPGDSSTAGNVDTGKTPPINGPD